MLKLQNKKIGIWGFGVVGTSVYNYVKQLTPHIQIMDQKPHAIIPIIPQTPENTEKFLIENDVIFPSPGIPLHQYKKYHHKFIHELDIFKKHFHNKTIAITGTVGKTTITSFLQQCISNSIAAGNIGHAMLNVLSQQPQPETVVLELSSYQLHYAQNFAPDIAIWTNFYPNHLDHHLTKKEYFLAKCNLLKYQNHNQIALLSYKLLSKIQKHININAQMFLFAKRKPKVVSPYPVFYLHKNSVWLSNKNNTQLIFENIDQLPDITFTENWLVVIAALFLYKIPLSNLISIGGQIKAQPHRVEFVKHLHGVAIYNDSKSTVWQATQCALQQFKNKKTALFLGGISKGADRTPLIKFLQKKPISVFAFGKEADLLAELCTKFNISCYKSATLQEALNQYLARQHNFNVLLFSPAGASFDLFKNYEDRGAQFKNMIENIA